MIRKNGENGYILLDAVIISFLLLALSSGMYFLKINSINRINCISSINADYIAQLEEKAKELDTYKQNEADFEKEKEKWYEDVVFSEDAPDISNYKEYYEL